MHEKSNLIWVSSQLYAVIFLVHIQEKKISFQVARKYKGIYKVVIVIFIVFFEKTIFFVKIFNVVNWLRN